MTAAAQENHGVSDGATRREVPSGECITSKQNNREEARCRIGQAGAAAKTQGRRTSVSDAKRLMQTTTGMPNWRVFWMCRRRLQHPAEGVTRGRVGAEPG